MPKKRTPESIKNPETSTIITNGYTSLEDYNSKAIDGLGAINRAQANTYRRDYSGLLSNTSGRPGLTREDYDYFRPDEETPTTYPEILHKCNGVYRNTGLIRNIIDLMGDFTVKGVHLVHPNRKIERFFQNWWAMVHGTAVTERMSNILYRLGNVPVQVYTTKITPTQLEKMQRASGSPDKYGLPNSLPELETRELPYKYVTLNPSTVIPIGGPLSSFLDKPVYGLVLPQKLRQIIKAPKNDQERAIVSKLPPEMIEAAKSNKPYILNQDKLYVLHYKKDDWKTYADPMIYAILDDVALLEKLKLADASALDGSTNRFRIFKMGSMEHKIAPSPALAEKLYELLQNNTGAGTTDIVWGPDIDIIETDTSAYQFLGDAKYKATMNNIYAGLGIPPTLTGTFGAAGTTNNAISLKTLVERLEYGRSIITDFWDKQIKQVQMSMGFRFPAKVVFDKMILGNEDSEKALLIQLADRNLISDEMLQNLFKHDPELERVRMKREQQERESGKRVAKAGAWHDPQPENKLKQIALQSGQVSPSEVGLELEERKEGETSMMEGQREIEKEKLQILKNRPAVSPKAKPKGRSGQGRPKTSKDKTRRKTKTFRTRSILEAWTRGAYSDISDIINEGILHIHGKKNLRQLSTDQIQESEMLKFSVLCSVKPFTNISKTTVHEHVNAGLSREIKALYNTLTADFVKAMGRQPNLDETRNIQINVYLNLIDGDY